MLIPAILGISKALPAVDAVIPHKHHRQFIHFRSFKLWSHECSLIDLREPSVQHLLSFAGIRCVCALSERATMTVILNPPYRRVVPLVDTASAFLASHRSSRFFAFAQRAKTALRAISLRSVADTLLARAFAPLLPIADNSAAERLAARAFPPLLPSATAFGFFFSEPMPPPFSTYTKLPLGM